MSAPHLVSKKLSALGRILVLTSETPFALEVFRELARCEPESKLNQLGAIVVPSPRTTRAPGPPIPVESPSELRPLAEELKIPLLSLWPHAAPAHSFDGRDQDGGSTPLEQPTMGAFAELVRRVAADIVLSLCWPFRIPEPWLDVPRWGAYNIHPALLPYFRGPSPLFWQLRDGVRTGGVTLHEMTSRLDEGPVVAQQRVNLTRGVTLPQLTTRLARGAVAVLGEMLSGEVPPQRLERAGPVTHGGGSYQGWPTAQDFTLDLSWRAERAYRFLRGTEAFRQSYGIKTASGCDVVVHRALSLHPGGTLRGVKVESPGRVALGFSDGVVRAAGRYVRPQS